MTEGFPQRSFGRIAGLTEVVQVSETATRQRHNTDLTGEQRTIVEKALPPIPSGGWERTVDLREVVNAILYCLRTACSWKMLPHDFPPRSTVFE